MEGIQIKCCLTADRQVILDKLLLFCGSDRQIPDLHSLWDGLLIAKALRSVPSNYSRPLPSRKIEYSLRGTIYDSYVRRIMWEGVLGKWRDEIPGWLACPSESRISPPTSALGSVWQSISFLWSRLTQFIGGAQETDDELLCPHYWAEPIHKLNCDIVWPKALDQPPYNDTRLDGASSCDPSIDMCLSPEYDETSSSGAASASTPSHGPYLELDTPEYSGVISEQWIVEKLLAQAGIRLAGVLNWLFADLEENGGRFNRRLEVFY